MVGRIKCREMTFECSVSKFESVLKSFLQEMTAVLAMLFARDVITSAILLEDISVPLSVK